MPKPFLVRDANVAGPATHALVIGVGAYPHLPGGTGTESAHHDGMEQLTSPPISARQFASWLLSEFNHPTKPLASVGLLLSEAQQQPFADPQAPANNFVAPTPNLANATLAVEELFRRGDENPDNLLLFYFCGHGIAEGADTALLLSDYGANDLHPLRGALDFRRLRLGMARSKASEQCFFVDACRASTDTLIEAFGNAGEIIIGAGPRPFGLPFRRAPVFYATLNGFKAYALPGQPTVFTEALLKALRNLAAGDEMGDWRVSTNNIQTAVEHVASRRMIDMRKQQVPTSDDQSTIYINFLPGAPNALVYVKSDPPDALAAADLTYQIAGGNLLPAPAQARKNGEWALELLSGNYDFSLSVPAKPPCVVANSVRPAFRFITVKVPP